MDFNQEYYRSVMLSLMQQHSSASSFVFETPTKKSFETALLAIRSVATENLQAEILRDWAGSFCERLDAVGHRGTLALDAGISDGKMCDIGYCWSDWYRGEYPRAYICTAEEFESLLFAASDFSPSDEDVSVLFS
jgi:hypothetical protein